jgi:hypothetical protein
MIAKSSSHKSAKGFLSSFAFIGAIAGVGLASYPAQAAFIGQYSGYTVFGGPPDLIPTPQCPLCDSTVNFSVYENTDGNWTDDSEFANLNTTSLLNGIDSSARYVYLYQVINTNPLPQGEDDLLTFNIAVEEIDEDWRDMGTLPYIGPYDGPNPYTSGGYLDGTVFANASRATEPLDTPGNWEPGPQSDVFPFVTDSNAVNPTRLTYEEIRDDAVEQLNNPVGVASPTQGMSFLFGTEIPADATSSVLFLTSNEVPDFPWARTQSGSGEGTSGDVVGVKVSVDNKIPEPTSTLAILGISSLSLILKRKKISHME